MTLAAAIEISFVARHPSSPPLHHPWRRPPCQIPLALTVASLTPPSIAAPLKGRARQPAALGFSSSLLDRGVESLCIQQISREVRCKTADVTTEREGEGGREGMT